jgi:hypothetical protein
MGGEAGDGWNFKHVTLKPFIRYFNGYKWGDTFHKWGGLLPYNL